MGLPSFLKREIRPLEYSIEIQRNPLSDNPNARSLIIVHPLEQESFVYTLDEDTQTRLHEGTAPALDLPGRIETDHIHVHGNPE